MKKTLDTAALPISPSPEAMLQKLAAEGLGTWIFKRHGTKQTFALPHNITSALELPTPLFIAGTEFVEQYVHPDDKKKMHLFFNANYPQLAEQTSFRFRIKNKKNLGWQLVKFFGSVDIAGQEAEPVQLSGYMQLEDSATSFPQEQQAATPNIVEQIVDITQLATWDWDLPNDRVTVNQLFFTSLGYEEAKRHISFGEWAKLIHPEDTIAVQQGLKDHFSGLTELFLCDYRLRRHDGYYTWVHATGKVIAWDESKRPSRIVGGHFDIDSTRLTDTEAQRLVSAVDMQKKVLEEELTLRENLLKTVHERIHTILSVAELANSKAPQPDLALRHEKPGSASHTYFAQSLSESFDFITEKMWWYKSIIDSIPFPLSLTTTDDKWVFLNAAALAAYGVKNPAAILGQDKNNWLANFTYEQFEESSPDQNNVTRFSLHDKVQGTIYQGQSSYLNDSTGNHTGVIQTMQDVTLIHEADERIRIMLDSNPLACTFWNADAVLLDCNKAVITLFGLDSKEEYLTDPRRLEPQRQPNGELSSALMQRYIKETFTTGYQQFEWLHLKKNGSPMPAEVTLVRVRRQQGDTIVVGYIRDLTALKETQAELDKERNLLQLVMDSSPVCFVIMVQGVTRYVTPFAKQFFGIQDNSDLGTIYIDAAEKETFTHELKTTGSVNWRVLQMRAADGSTKEMLVHAFTADYYGEQCVMSWFLDVTELRQRQRELQDARDLAEQSALAKSAFLANMSHEIRTPMNAILGMIHLVLNTKLTPHQADYLEKAQFSAKALLRIINDILDFSKIEAGKLEMEEIEFTLAEVVQGILDLLNPGAERKGLEFSIRLHPKTPARLVGDPLRLTQILTNLANNAIKFTEQGYVIIHITPVSVNDIHSILEFRVEDTGIGLSKEQLSTIFAPFSQADTSTTRRYGGTGLGLSISRRLIALMDGGISCSSVIGKGTVFTFTARFGTVDSSLVVSEVSSRSSLDKQKQLHAEKVLKQLQNCYILIAEDNEINQIIALELLEHVGFIVDIASNGLEALEMACKRQYDLILMDIQMPEMDGLSATTEIRKHKPLEELPIIAMTAHAMVGDKERSLHAGMNDHITKPLDAAEVYTVLAKHLLPPDHEAVADESAEMIPLSLGNPSLQLAEKKEEDCLEPLPENLPGVDIAAGLTNSGKQQSLYKHWLLTLAEDWPTRTEKIINAAMMGESHLLLSSLATLRADAMKVGATQLAEIAQSIILSAQQADYPTLFLQLDMLESHTNLLTQAITDFFDVPATGTTPSPL